MLRKLIKSAGSILMGAILFLGLTMAAKAQSGNLINAYASNCWDIAKDNNNRVYIMWFNKSVLYFGEIKNNQVTGVQIITNDIHKNLKYTASHLSVRPDGQSMHVIYINSRQKELMHAWRIGDGIWRNETAYRASGKDKVYFQAGAVGGDGTVHAVFTKTGSTRYCYKKPGKAWSSQIDLDNNNSEGTRVEVDCQGGVHCTWMPYKNYLFYRYAPNGKTLDKSPTEKIGMDCEAGFRVGIGDIFITKEGIVHQVLLYHRKLFHTSKPIGGTWPREIWVKNGSDTGLELRASVGADARGRIFVSWGIATYGGRAMLSTFDKGDWTPVAVGRGTNFGDYNDPSITVTDNAAYILWSTQPNDQLFLYSIPLIPVVSAINVSVEPEKNDKIKVKSPGIGLVNHETEKSFFKSYHFNRINWEDSPYNISNHVQVKSYNIYRKAKSAREYSTTPLTNIPAGTLTFLDKSSATNTTENTFDYFVTAVALINGKEVESEFVFSYIYLNRITWKDAPFNIDNHVHIDHYNIYRKTKSVANYSGIPLVKNIPASTQTHDDLITEAEYLENNFDYYVTTVALIDGKLVESAIIY